MVPREFQALFPSIRIADLDPVKDKNFILDSLLHNATGPAWDWMLRKYTQKDIANVVMDSRRLTPRDVYYWINKFNLPAENVRCLQKNSRQQSFPY